ncbi:bpX6 domain-containing protein [Pseudomonas sp. KNUC1026]|uniref:bpX6 domain-containing protein n=1 Tax=Pseudomonas sp. KNUC1026 TaxID=2893890 RepID=UPI001F446868|nr:bpX6 domain-containing protein [Pseudomonas sp. KNUC1026]UFH50807.1 hypothetical protein LN139_06695 [Pseudomonas sp. KNUC1026]
MQHLDALKIRRPTLTGSQPVAALWFAAERFSEAERAQLILAHWHTGASAFRFAEGDLLRFPKAHTLLCEGLAGWPLIRQGRALCSAQLAAEERQRLAPADVWLVRGSRADALHLRDAQALAPSQWIEIGQYALLDTYDCRDALPEPFSEPEPVVTDIREILGDAVGAPSAERMEVMRALLERQARAQQAKAPGNASTGAKPRQGASGPNYNPRNLIALVLAAGFFGFHQYRSSTRVPASSGTAPDKPLHSAASSFSWDLGTLLVAMLVGAVVLTLLLMGLRALLNRRYPTEGAREVARPVRPVRPVRPTAPGVPPRANGRPRGPAVWRRWLARLAEKSSLSKLYGNRQAAYLQRMLDLFEAGDLHEALRHALPLGDGNAPKGQAFGTRIGATT